MKAWQKRDVAIRQRKIMPYRVLSINRLLQATSIVLKNRYLILSFLPFFTVFFSEGSQYVGALGWLGISLVAYATLSIWHYVKFDPEKYVNILGADSGLWDKKMAQNNPQGLYSASLLSYEFSMIRYIVDAILIYLSIGYIQDFIGQLWDVRHRWFYTVTGNVLRCMASIGLIRTTQKNNMIEHDSYAKLAIICEVSECHPQAQKNTSPSWYNTVPSWVICSTIWLICKARLFKYALGQGALYLATALLLTKLVRKVGRFLYAQKHAAVCILQSVIATFAAGNALVCFSKDAASSILKRVLSYAKTDHVNILCQLVACLYTTTLWVFGFSSYHLGLHRQKIQEKAQKMAVQKKRSTVSKDKSKRLYGDQANGYALSKRH